MKKIITAIALCFFLVNFASGENPTYRYRPYNHSYYRSVPNIHGGYRYYQRGYGYIGRSSSNSFGGQNYYNRYGSFYMRSVPNSFGGYNYRTR